MCWRLVYEVYTAKEVAVFRALAIRERRLNIREQFAERSVAVAAQINSSYVAVFVARKSTESTLVRAHTIAHGAAKHLLEARCDVHGLAEASKDASWVAVADFALTSAG